MSSGSKVKVKTYDPSKMEANIQMKRGALEQTVKDKVFETSQRANSMNDMAIEDLNKGLGLLSSFLDTRIQGQKDTNTILNKVLNKDVPTLYDQARMGAASVVDAFSNKYGGS